MHEILNGDKFIIAGTASLWEIMAPDQVIDSITELGVKDKGTYTEIIFNAMQEAALTQGALIDDTTIVISHIN